MTTYLSLDLSKVSTGYALWRDSMDRPISGTWNLGDSRTPRGESSLKLNRQLTELRKAERFDFMFVEAPIAQRKRQGTSERNVRLALALHAHAESFAASKRMFNRFLEYSEGSWRTGFLGKDENSLIRRAAKQAGKSARDPLKAASMERCRQLGLIAPNDDEADALGLLTYGLLSNGITPPWIARETLRPQLAGAAA